MKKMASVAALLALTLSPVSQATGMHPMADANEKAFKSEVLELPMSAMTPVSGMDELLMQIGIIGSDYKYKDIAAAVNFFDEVTAEAEKVAPLRLSENIEATSFTFSPYYSEFVYRYLYDIEPDMAIELEKELSKPAVLNELCGAAYDHSKYLRANSHTVVVTFNKKDSHKLTELILNNHSCKA